MRATKWKISTIELLPLKDGYCELCRAKFDSSFECSFIVKIEERIDPTWIFNKRRKEGTLDTKNKNGCFRWVWLINWAVCKLTNHIVFPEHQSSQQTSNIFPSGQHRLLSCGMNRSTSLQKLAPKLVNQLYLFYEMLRTRSSLLQVLPWRILQAPLRTQVLCRRQQKRLHPRKEKDTILNTRTLFLFFILTSD